MIFSGLPPLPPLATSGTQKNLRKKVLRKIGIDTKETWDKILSDGGSVQDIKELDGWVYDNSGRLTQEDDGEKVKDVFKTFGEISQKDIVIQAAQRQKHIDQGQSLNLMISPKCPPKQVSELLIFGWEQGVKSFYYQRSANPSQELARSILSCAACER